ncbi:MAG: hypothetical protein AAFR17_13340, partial [Pseudomonadota bacterium]
FHHRSCTVILERNEALARKICADGGRCPRHAMRAYADPPEVAFSDAPPYTARLRSAERENP